MATASTAKVSHRGQMSLPAELRHRWGLAEGGEVGVIDLGHAALIIPGGIETARSELDRVLRERYEDGVNDIDAPELSDQ